MKRMKRKFTSAFVVLSLLAIGPVFVATDIGIIGNYDEEHRGQHMGPAGSYGWSEDTYVYATDEMHPLWHSFTTGVYVEVWGPWQCYPGETISVPIAIEAIEDIKNMSVDLHILASKSEGYVYWEYYNPWLIDSVDLSEGDHIHEHYDVLIRPDVSPGLAYGKLVLKWSFFRESTWMERQEEGNFRVTYIKNKELESTRELMYGFLMTTIVLSISTVYFAFKRRKAES